ncbi:HpaII family restriction endonuclease [Bacillus paranthracis]
MVTLNKGEWSEVYTVLKLLADGKLYAADSDLNKMESIYYPLIKILRSELLNKQLTNYEYLYEETINCPEDVKIRIVHGDTSDTLLELSVEEFKNNSLQLLKDIQEGQGRSFTVSPDVERFLQSIYISKMSESSDKKRDITIVVHDLVTGFEPELGFSIKSKLGKAATLF